VVAFQQPGELVLQRLSVRDIHGLLPFDREGRQRARTVPAWKSRGGRSLGARSAVPPGNALSLYPQRLPVAAIRTKNNYFLGVAQHAKRGFVAGQVAGGKNLYFREEK
jgi:hypothetical protein